MVVKIHVVYCGAWGYAPKFKAFRDELFKTFKEGEIEVTGEGTPNQSGKFEVQIEGGKLIHSKLDGGGFPHTDKNKMAGIIQAIREHM